MTHITYLLLMRMVHLSLMILQLFKLVNSAHILHLVQKSGDVNDAAADFEYELSSLYLMDEYTMSDSVTLTFGIRYDEYSGDDTPTNQSFVNKYGFKNGGIKGTDLFTYRFGADIVLDDLSDINITFGTYSAKLPNVWLSNAYTYTGINVANYDSAYGGCPGTLQ